MGIQLFADLYPDMRFIHVVRDGRDMALSKNKQQAETYLDHFIPDIFVDKSVIRAAAYWNWAVINCQASWQHTYLPTANYMVIRYEDLCDESKPYEAYRGQAIKEIVRFVHQDMQKAIDPKPYYKLIDPSAGIGRWKLAPVSIQRAIEWVCHEGLRAYGYFGA